MKAHMVIAMLLVALHVQAEEEKPDVALVQAASEDAKTLRVFLDDDWKVEAIQNEIVLTSKFEVFHVALFRAPGDPGMPEFSDSVPRSELIAHGQPQNYVIRLDYSRLLSKEEYEKRVTKRQNAAFTLAFGTQVKAEYNEEESAPLQAPQLSCF